MPFGPLEYNVQVVMQLPDGRRVDLGTREGWDPTRHPTLFLLLNELREASEPGFDPPLAPRCIDFLAVVPDTITRNVCNCEAVGLPPLEQRAEAENIQLFAAIHNLGVNLPEDKRASVHDREKEALVSLFARWCRNPPKSKRRFARTGLLSQDEHELVNAMVAWSQDASVVDMMLQGGRDGPLGALAALVGTCAKPCEHVMSCHAMMASNCARLLEKRGAGVREIDSCGALEQVIRTCWLHDDEQCVGPCLGVLSMVAADIRFVRKGLNREGSGAAAALRDAVAGLPTGLRGLGGERLKLAQKLQELSFAREATKGEGKASRPPGAQAKIGRMCRACSKEEVPPNHLLQCARCKVAYYCDKGCQKSDWKRHKGECRVPDSGSDMKSASNAANAFIQRHLGRIRFDLRRLSAPKRGNTDPSQKPSMRDFLMAVDLQEGTMREGVYDLGLVSDLLERRWAPEVCKEEGLSPDAAEMNISGLVQQVGIMIPTLTDNTLMILSRFQGRIVLLRCQQRMPDGTQLFSPELLNASEEEAMIEEFRLRSRV